MTTAIREHDDSNPNTEKHTQSARRPNEHRRFCHGSNEYEDDEEGDLDRSDTGKGQSCGKRVQRKILELRQDQTSIVVRRKKKKHGKKKKKKQGYGKGKCARVNSVEVEQHDDELDGDEHKCVTTNIPSLGDGFTPDGPHNITADRFNAARRGRQVRNQTDGHMVVSHRSTSTCMESSTKTIAPPNTMTA